MLIPKRSAVTVKIGCLWVLEVGAMLALIASSLQVPPQIKASDRAQSYTSELARNRSMRLLASDPDWLKLTQSPGRGLPGRREVGGSRHT
jgi:hypothetical protein